MIIIFALAFGFIAIFLQTQTYYFFKKNIKQETLNQQVPFQKAPTQYIWYIIQVILFLGGVLLAIFQYPDQDSLAIAIIMMLFALSSIIAYASRRSFYYNKNGFINMYTFYPYKNIESIKPKIFSPGLFIVTTSSREQLIVPKSHALYIKEQAHL
ncbi:MAG: hypothetical protein ACRCTA_05890 [Bacilli bacterium]